MRRNPWWRILLEILGKAANRPRRPLVRPRLQLERLEDRVTPANVDWIGNGVGAGALWGNSANWLNEATTTHVVPTAADIAVFNAADTNGSTIDNTFAGGAVAGISITAGYTGTISNQWTLLPAGFSIGTSGFSQAGGTFNAGTATTLTDAGTWSEAATFTASTSTVVFTAASGTQSLDSGGQNFKNVQHTGAGALQLANNSLTVTGTLDNEAGALDLNGQNLSVAGVVTNKSTIMLQGTETVTLTSGNDTTEGAWLYYGNNTAGPLTIDNFTGADYFNLTINDANPTEATYQLGADTVVAGSFTLTSGTFTQLAHNLTVTKNFSLANGTTFTKATTAAHTLTLSGTGNLTDSNPTPTDLGAVTVSGARTLTTSITVDSLNVTAAGTLIQGAGNTLTIGGNLTLASGGTFTKDTSTGTLIFNASGIITDSNATPNDLGKVEIANNSTTTLASAVLMDGLTIDSGSTFALAGFNFSFSAAAAVANNGVFALDGNETLTHVTNLGNAAGTVEYVGNDTAGPFTIKTFSGTDYFNLTINDANPTEATYQLGADTVVAGSFTLTSGTFTQLAHNLTVAKNFSLASGTTFTKATTAADTVTLSGTGNLTDNNATSQDLGAVTVSGARTLTTSITMDSLKVNAAGTVIQGAGNTLTIGGSLTLASGGTFTKDTGAGTLIFNGSGAITDSNAAPNDLGNVEITNNSTTTLGSAVLMDGLTIDSGSTFALAGFNFSFSAAAAVANNGVFALDGNETLTHVNNLGNAAGTVEYVGKNTVGPFTIKTFSGTDYFNLTIDDTNLTTGTFQPGATLSIAGALTVSGGTFDANRQTVTISGGLTVNGGAFIGDGGTINTTNVTLSSGTLTAPTSADGFNVSGNWAETGGTFTPGPGTVTFNGGGTQTLNSGGASFNNIEHSGAGVLQLLTSALTVGGTLTNDGGAGNFDAAANSLATTVTGLTTLTGGAYLAGSATQGLSGGLIINGGAFTGNSGTVNTTNVTLSNGTLTAPSSDGAFNVSGNWANSSGTFNANGGTVTLTGAGQSISGANTFVNLTKIVTAADTLTFGAGAANKSTVTGALTLLGALGKIVALRSATPGTPWQIDPQGTRSVSFVNVKDSKNVNTIYIHAASATNAGNNTRWTFANGGAIEFDSDGGDLTLVRVSVLGTAFLELVDDNGNVLDANALASVTSVTINGQNGSANTFIIDYATGGKFTIPGGGTITFNGGTGAGSNNTLEVNGGAFTNATVAFTPSDANGNNGSVSLDGQAIAFSHLQPMLLNVGSAANVEFDLPNSTNDVAFEASGVPATPLQLRSTDATPTFETTEFTDPTASLKIVSFAGTTNSFTVSSASPPIAFDGAFTYVAGAGATDTVNLNSALTLGNAGGNTGAISINATTITVNKAIDTTAGTAGSVTLTATGLLTVNDNITTTGANNVSLQGDGVTQGSAATVNAGAGTIIVNGGGGAISLGGSLTTTNASASAVTIHDATTAALGNITATSGGLVVGVGQDITGAVTQTNGTTLNTGALAASTAASLTLTKANAINTLGSVIRGGAFSLTDGSALTITGPITGGAIANAVTITSGGTLAINGNISTSGANNVSLQGVGVTEAAGATVNGGAGTITINGGAGAIDLKTGTLQTANAGASAVTIHNATTVALGNVTATGGTLVLGLAQDITGAVTQNAAAGLSVSTVTANTNNSINLGNAGNAIPNVGSIAGNGTVIVNDSNTLTVAGTINSAGNDITLCTSAAGGIAVNNAVNAGTGTVRLQSSGGVTQTAAITAASLGVNAGGTVSLINGSNAVGTIAATSTNTVSFTDSVGFATGQVASSACFPTTVIGVSTTANNAGITLTANGGTLQVAAGENVSANGSGGVTLSSTGSTSDITINGTLGSTTGAINVGAGRNIAFGAVGAVSTSTSAAGASVTLTASSTGTITQTGAGTAITGNALSLTAGGGIGAGANPIVMNGATLTADSSAGPNPQFLADTATISLNAANALNAGSGTVELEGGTFQIQAGAGANAIAASSGLILVAPAILDLHGFTAQIVSLSDGGATGGTVTNSAAGPATLDITNGASKVFSGVIQNGVGATALEKTGTGTQTQTLSGANTYSGGTTITGGILSISSDGNLGGVPGSAATNVTISGGTLRSTATFPLNANRNISLTGAGSIEAGAGATFTINGIVSGAFTLTLIGPGNVSLAGGASISSASGDGIDLRAGGDIRTAIFTINNSSIANNTGSGIQIFTEVGAVTITNSTIAGNSAANGGGISVASTYSQTVTLTNDTLDGNSATTGNGGGIFNGSSADTLFIADCTIANNRATAGSGGGFFTVTGATLTLVNTIVASDHAATDPDIVATVTGTSVNNLIGIGTGLSGILTDVTHANQVGTALAPINPLLAVLGNYGGSVQTDALLPGSPALDAGNNADVPAGVTTDERGFPRIVDTTVDIGAFESSGFTVTPQAPVASINRTLISQSFVSPTDGSTHVTFQVSVAPKNLAEPIAGGVLTFAAIPGGGGDSATPQTPSVTLNATGVASTQAVANGIASPAVGTTYQLNASAGGKNTAGSFSLFNQKVTSFFYNVPGGNTTAASPQNAQSGNIIQLKSSNGVTSPTFTVTMLDQETPTPQTVAITGQSVALGAVYGAGAITGATKASPIVITSVNNGLVTGQQVVISGVLGNTNANGIFTVTVVDANHFKLNGSVGNGVYVANTGSFDKGYINAITNPTGFPAVTLAGGVASTTTVSGVAHFMNLQVFQSVYSTPYVLKAYYTNPAPDSMRPTGVVTTSTFRVLPYEFLTSGGNFAGFLQTAYNIEVASSARGAIRLLSINATTTNRLTIQAFDYFSGTEAKSNVIVTAATTYNGPVFLTFDVAAEMLSPKVLFAADVPTLIPISMTAGVLGLSNVTTTGAVPTTGFSVSAGFGLTAGVPPVAAPLLFDAEGFAEVNDNVPTSRTVSTFIRINLGRLRGR